MADLHAPPHARQADQLWLEMNEAKNERDQARNDAEVNRLGWNKAAAERDEAVAAHASLLAAARGVLALLDRFAVAAMQLKGAELDELRRACRG